MNETEVKTRIVLVDDQRMMRDGLRALFEQCADMEIIGESDSDLTWPRADAARPMSSSWAWAGPSTILWPFWDRSFARWPQARVIALAAVLNRALLAGVLPRRRPWVCHQSSVLLRNCWKRSGRWRPAPRICVPEPRRSCWTTSTQGGSDSEGPRGMPLTEREATILQLLAEGRTSKEIAAAVASEFQDD